MDSGTDSLTKVSEDTANSILGYLERKIMSKLERHHKSLSNLYIEYDKED